MNRQRVPVTARRGAIAPLTAIVLIILLAMIAFAVDIGYLNVVRNQAQNCADAAALAGAAKLAERLKAAPIVNGSPLQTAADLQMAVAEAKAYARRNAVGNVKVELMDSDIQIGYLADPYNQSANTLDKGGWPARPYNAVRVNVARDADHEGGPLKFFFAPVIGVDDAVVRATATACLPMGDPIIGFRGLLPFTFQVDQWKAVLNADTAGTFQAANGANVTVTDSFAVAANATNALGVRPVGDGRVETRIYPAGLTNGNHGSINFSMRRVANSTNLLRDVIINGPSEKDFPDLPKIVAASPTNPVPVNADPGISAGMEPALQAIIGQPRAIPLYSTAAGSGNNGTFRIVGFAPVTVVDVNLTGKEKYVTVQPRLVFNKSGIDGDDRTMFNITPTANPNPLYIGRCVLVR